MHHVSCNDFGFLCSFWVEYQISHSPHFGAIWTGFQTVYSGPEVNKLERGLKPTETYVSKDSGGLGVWCVWTTYSWRCQCGGRQWERQKSNIFRWLAKQQLCTYCTTDDVKMPNFTFVENANKWQSTFFFSLNFDIIRRNLTPREFELASPIACSSRVDSRDSPLRRACSQAKVSKSASTLESFVLWQWRI